ncbi:MAG: hypothetical protein ABH829_02255 [archaeon]
MASKDDLSRLTQSIILAKNELSTAISQETKSLDDRMDKLSRKMEQLKAQQAELDKRVKAVDRDSKKNSKIIESQVEDYLPTQVTHLNAQVASLNERAGGLQSKMETVKTILDKVVDMLKSGTGPSSDLMERVDALEGRWAEFESLNLLPLIDKLESIQEDIRSAHSSLPARDISELDIRMSTMESKIAGKAQNRDSE